MTSKSAANAAARRNDLRACMECLNVSVSQKPIVRLLRTHRVPRLKPETPSYGIFSRALVYAWG